MTHGGEVGNVPEGVGGNFEQNPEGGTASVARKGDSAKSGYLTFDPDGISTINWRTIYQESESKSLLEVKQIKVQRQSYKCLKRPDQIISK